MELPIDEKKILLKAARESILTMFDEGEVSEIDYDKYPRLKQELGAFVTLKINDQLKGCIGFIIAHDPLFDTVVDAAKHAAFNDPRFPELNRKEVDDITIEISVLSTFEPIKSYDEIIIGKHGLLLDEGARAVLLPQVATEQNFTRAEFLTALCHKAGLYGNYWKERMLNIKIFTAVVFGEEEEE